jgi:preprotein translocase subunit SecB
MTDTAQQTDQTPALRVLTQYVKDLSFENPGAPEALRGGQPSPAIDLSIDVQARRMEDGMFEVELHTEARASRGETVVFLAELKYAGVFELVNIPAEQIEPLILIECPRMLFPFARRILADVTRDGAFPPLFLEPIDFAALYQQQRIAARDAAAAGNA